MNDRQDVAHLLERFVESWRAEVCPEIESYLPSDDDLATKRALLVELIMVDLEYRWRLAARLHSGDPPTGASDSTAQASLPTWPRLEDYVLRYSDLGGLAKLPLELVCEEYRVRRCYGDHPSQADYLHRFPDHNELANALSGIDTDCVSALAATVAQPGERDEPQTHDSEVSSRDTRTLQTEETSPGIGHGAGVPMGTATEFSDYELLNEIARGGMGVVYRARQTKANRLVALKMILSGGLANDDEIRRFHTEVEAAAKLEHVGIVRIYDVGDWRGQPYFSMGFVDGPSLKERIAQSPLPPREAAETLRSISEAVAYAHEKGVIHRDLKPANILLEGGTNPRITDFGLAKQLDADSQLTVAGQIMGTPSYMAPEQAAGNNEAVGLSADVYALGAILYSMLTGRPPFQAATVAETLAQVTDREPVMPRQLNPTIPLDLQTICLKCLEKNPASRYGSASAVVDELRRYLDGKPILARPVSRGEHFRRWVVRNPVVASLVGTVIVTLSVGLIVSMSFARAKQQESERLRERTQELQLSQVNMKNTIDRYVDTVVNNRFLANRQFQPTLRQLLADALEHYRRLALDFRGDEEHFSELERALNRLAQISKATGEREESVLAHQECIKLMQSLIARNDTPRYRRQLAAHHMNLGRIYAEAEDAPLAQKQFRIAVEILRNDVDGEGFLWESAQILAGCLYYSASIRDRDKNAQTAIDLLDQAIEIGERVVMESNDSRALDDLASYYDLLGTSQLYLERHAEARVAFDAAKELREQLVQRDPDNERYTSGLSNITNQFGRLAMQQGHNEEALEYFKAAYAVRKQLADSNPLLHSVQYSLAESDYYLGQVFTELGQVVKAIEHLQRAITLSQRLIDEDPTVFDYHVVAVVGHMELGNVFHAIGQHTDAIESYEAAVSSSRTVTKPTWREDLRTPDIKAPDLTSVYANMSKAHISLRQFQRGMELSEQVVRTLKERVSSNSASPVEIANLAKAHANLGTAHSELGNLEEAKHHLEIAQKTIHPLVTGNSDAADWQITYATSMSMLGTVQIEMGEVREAIRQLKAAHEFTERLRETDRSQRSLRMLAQVSANLSAAYLAINRLPEATKLAQSAVKAYESLLQLHPASPEYQYGRIVSNSTLGDICIRNRDAEKGIRQFQMVVDLCLAVPEEKRSPEIRWQLGQALMNQGVFLRQKDEHERAKANFVTAIKTLRDVLAEVPGHTHCRMTLALSLANESLARRADGEYDAAIQSIEDALRQRASVLGVSPNHIQATSMASQFAEVRAGCYNSRAWHLATSAIDAERDGERAVADAELACRVGKEHYSRLDTLAAAYAEVGDFEKAVATAKKAISAVPLLQRSKAKDLRARLQLYEKGKPYRQSTKTQAGN